MKAALILLDRTAVLFLGVAAGIAIGYAFGVVDRPVAPMQDLAANTSAVPPPRWTPTSPEARASSAPGFPLDQPVPEASGPIKPGIVNALAAGRRVRLGVFGDSFGDGVWSGLYRQLGPKRGYDVLKFSQQATGFTRYRTLNIEEHDRKRLANAPVDIAVISFGANDMMGVMHQGRVAPLLSAKWKDEIGARVSSYVAMLRGQGAIVYWVGLPRMRDASYEADVARMNAFYRGLMAQLDVPFIDTAPLSVDADGRYAPYLPDPTTGKKMLMRANDGIHMSMNGYIRITAGLSRRIQAYVDAARAQAGVAPDAKLAATPALPVPPIEVKSIEAKPIAPVIAAKPEVEKPGPGKAIEFDYPLADVPLVKDVPKTPPKKMDGGTSIPPDNGATLTENR